MNSLIGLERILQALRSLRESGVSEEEAISAFEALAARTIRDDKEAATVLVHGTQSYVLAADLGDDKDHCVVGLFRIGEQGVVTLCDYQKVSRAVLVEDAVRKVMKLR